jgi:hypothetical protein
VSAPAAALVPWVASWTSERTSDPDITYRRGIGTTGIAYPDETLADRDDHDILWLRRPESQGVGRPLFGIVHSGRQRRAMEQLLCQVCGQPADRDERGVLWLIESPDEDGFDEWPEGLMTTHPPVCQPCLDVAQSTCPHLLRGSAVLRVARPEIAAVWGRRYMPGGLVPRLLDPEGEAVLVDSLTAGWTLASQYVMELVGCTVLLVPQHA